MDTTWKLRYKLYILILIEIASTTITFQFFHWTFFPSKNISGSLFLCFLPCCHLFFIFFRVSFSLKVNSSRKRIFEASITCVNSWHSSSPLGCNIWSEVWYDREEYILFSFASKFFFYFVLGFLIFFLKVVYKVHSSSLLLQSLFCFLVFWFYFFSWDDIAERPPSTFLWSLDIAAISAVLLCKFFSDVFHLFFLNKYLKILSRAVSWASSI